MPRRSGRLRRQPTGLLLPSRSMSVFEPAEKEADASTDEQIAEEIGLTNDNVFVSADTYADGNLQIHLFFEGESLSADILSKIEESKYRQTSINWEAKCIVLESHEDQPPKQLVTDGGVVVENDQTDLWTYGQEAAERVDTCPHGRSWCDGPDTDPHCCLGCFEVDQ